MANLEKALSEVLDVVKHLVSTHVHWNVDLGKDEAVAKVETAKLALLAGEVQEILTDVSEGNLEETIADLEKTLADAKALRKPVSESE